MTVDWSDGGVVTLTKGVTATLGELDSARLYGVFLYNKGNGDTPADVTLTWTDNPDDPPTTVTVPGTAGDPGPAVIRFVSGGDASHISASVSQEQRGAKVAAFICNTHTPVDGGGLNDAPLPDNRRPQAFLRLTRFYCVPDVRWYATTVKADMDQFISVRFAEAFAHVTVVNTIEDPTDRIQGVGEAARMFQIDSTTRRSHQSKFEGDGSQQVWVNADCVQDSQTATLALQRLGY